MTTRLWRLSVLSALVAFFVIIAAPAAFAEAIGTISFLDGRVDILKAGQAIAIPVESGAPVSMGDIIRTKSNARAEITFSDGTILRLAQKTRIGVTDSSTLDLMRGRVRTIFASAAQGIKLRTPNGQAMANGKDFYFLHEKGSSWFYGAEGTVQASSMNAPADITFVENRDCARVTPGLTIENSCVFKDIDVQKFAWDTATVESTPVVAVLPAEGEVFTYTPLGGRAIDTPSLAVPIQNQDLVCTQCPPEVLRETVSAQILETKIGNFERIDKSNPVTP